MKKLISWILILTMLLSLTACGSESNEESTKKSGSKDTSVSTEKDAKNSSKTSDSDGKKTDGTTAEETTALPDNMTYVRVQTNSISFNYFAQQKVEDVTEMRLTFDEYGFVTLGERVRPAETKKTKEWVQIKSGNTLSYSFSPSKADAITIYLKDDGKIERIERKGDYDTIFSYAEGGSEYGAVYQVVTKGTNRDTIAYYNSQYRLVYNHSVMGKNPKESEHIYTDTDYCELGNLLWVSDTVGPDTCEIQRDAAGQLISHIHKESNGNIRFTDHFLQEGDEIPRDNQTYIFLNNKGELVEIAMASNDTSGNGNYSIGRYIYEEIPVVADDLLIAFLHIIPPDVTKTAETVLRKNRDKSW